jgi:hypothetical protein
MKKMVLGALAVLTFSMAGAQTARFGVKGGLNVSTLAGDVDDANPKIGAHIGGLVEIRITNKFAVQPELLLSLQGAKSTYSEFSSDYSYTSENKINLTYLNVPVMAKFYVIPSLSLEAGPQLGILVSAKNKFSETENDNGFVTTFSSTDDVKGGLKSIDASFNFGASYYFTKNIFVEARFCIGIANIDENGGYYRVDNGNGNVYRYGGPSVTNNVFQASFGYRF